VADGTVVNEGIGVGLANAVELGRNVLVGSNVGVDWLISGSMLVRFCDFCVRVVLETTITCSAWASCCAQPANRMDRITNKMTEYFRMNKLYLSFI
jgi:hypothetical protein